MQCFFASHELPRDNESGKTAVVTFHIPDLGIRFKAPFQAIDKDHSDFAALLALLEFIDSNQQFFSNRTYEIFGNNLRLVNGLNAREHLPQMYSPLVDRVREYRHKYRFSLDWVTNRHNPAIEPLSD